MQVISHIRFCKKYFLILDYIVNSLYGVKKSHTAFSFKLNEEKQIDFLLLLIAGKQRFRFSQNDEVTK